MLAFLSILIRIVSKVKKETTKVAFKCLPRQSIKQNWKKLA